MSEAHPSRGMVGRHAQLIGNVDARLGCRVVGGSIEGHPTAALATNALGMAIDHRESKEGGTVIYSGLLPSMRTAGDCYDDATIESFWNRMQVE